MKFFIIISILNLTTLFGSTVLADVLDTSTSKIVLQEFTFILDHPSISNKIIHCSKEEVKKAVINHYSFSSEKDNSLRKLIPTYLPLENQASWLMEKEECKSMNPYFNGIGFDSFNVVNGTAIVYIAAFNKKPINEQEWGESNDNPYTKLRLLLKPEFNVINVIKFTANCEVKSAGLVSSLTGAEDRLVCSLNNSKGEVIFNIKK